MNPYDTITYLLLMLAGGYVLYLEYVRFPRKGRRPSPVMKVVGIVLVVINFAKFVISLRSFCSG